MADIPITSLAFAEPPLPGDHVVGSFLEAVAKYKTVYFDPTGNGWRAANASGGTDVEAGSRGVGINNSDIVNVGDWGHIVQRGRLIINSSGFTAGNTYCVGGVSDGSIETDADVDTGGYRKTTLFIARDVTGTTQEVIMDPIPSNTVSS